MAQKPKSFKAQGEKEEMSGGRMLGNQAADDARVASIDKKIGRSRISRVQLDSSTGGREQ
ncbi:hypothetical protein EYF80_028581 [Liparis tanakae]|uniref:Uncharacterized protein n=1 Tax=Liparis tanakae TaxID=230148 RepID=A0A4Z2H634_9TELE|nr:hypothetical protein EYF80_028581 [Liparis tanakae]